MDPQESKYRHIPLQSLQRKEQPQGRLVQENQFINRLNVKTNERGKVVKVQQNREVFCYMDNGLKQRLFSPQNQFFMSFLIPYNQHGDVLLVPDNIWLAISFFLSRYIEENAQKMRHHFVSHQGQKQLVVVEQTSSVEESIESQKKWDFFFDKIIEKIEENTHKGVVQALSCNFSTTDKIYKTVSTAIIMNSFKKYFIYRSRKMHCGVNNLYFDGTREDWIKMKQKLVNLVQYDLDGTIKRYVENVQVILDKFLDSFDGKPDVSWWNTILETEEVRASSGVKQGTYAEGWLMHFLGRYYRTHLQDIPIFDISVPIILQNALTKKIKHLQLKADWVSVSKVGQFLYKPDVGLCIFKDSQEEME